MVAPKEVKDLFRTVGAKYNVALSSLKLVSGTELIIRYGLDNLGRARITINRSQIDDDRKLTALAEDIMSRLAVRLTPEQEKMNVARIADLDKRIAKHASARKEETVAVPSQDLQKCFSCQGCEHCKVLNDTPICKPTHGMHTHDGAVKTSEVEACFNDSPTSRRLHTIYGFVLFVDVV